MMTGAIFWEPFVLVTTLMLLSVMHRLCLERLRNCSSASLQRVQFELLVFVVVFRSQCKIEKLGTTSFSASPECHARRTQALAPSMINVANPDEPSYGTCILIRAQNSNISISLVLSAM